MPRLPTSRARLRVRPAVTQRKQNKDSQINAAASRITDQPGFGRAVRDLTNVARCSDNAADIDNAPWVLNKIACEHSTCDQRRMT